jgi:hypothetical protein
MLFSHRLPNLLISHGFNLSVNTVEYADLSNFGGFTILTMVSAFPSSALLALDSTAASCVPNS